MRSAAFWIFGAGAFDDFIMQTTRGILVALSCLTALSFTTPARADVTVYFGGDPVREPLVARPVAPPRGAPRVSEPVREPEPMRAPEPVRVTEPARAPEPVRAEPLRAPEPVRATEPVQASPPLTACVTNPPPVRFIRTTDGSRETRLLILTHCDGTPDAASLRALTILARPRSVAAPSEDDLRAHEDDADFLAADVHRLNVGLLSRLRRLADAFPGKDIEITSGYRPDAREGSRHRIGNALDLRVVDVPLEEMHRVALTFDESGIGLYPTSDFIHVDVRERVTRWVDLSGPDEPSNMVEVVTGRDGEAETAPPLTWTATHDGAQPATPPPAAPHPPRARQRPSRDATAPDVLEGLEALHDLDDMMVETLAPHPHAR